MLLHLLAVHHIEIPPGRIQPVCLEEIVCGPVKLVRAPLGHQHHLPARRVAEVGGVIIRGDLEFLDTFHRRGDRRLRTHVAAIARRIVIVTRQIVGGVAAVER